MFHRIKITSKQCCVNDSTLLNVVRIGFHLEPLFTTHNYNIIRSFNFDLSRMPAFILLLLAFYPLESNHPIFTKNSFFNCLLQIAVIFFRKILNECTCKSFQTVKTSFDCTPFLEARLFERIVNICSRLHSCDNIFNVSIFSIEHFLLTVREKFAAKGKTISMNAKMFRDAWLPRRQNDS